jgi:predicted transposase/invertase (TIGR01784 family)
MAKNDYIMFDWAAKRLLRQKSNFVVLEGFLTTLLGETIRIKHILESEGNKEDAIDKFNRVDMLAENSRGELVIIEVQNNRELNYFHRMLYGTSKVITEYISSGEPYEHVKKIYSVNIVYFDLGQGNDYVYHGYTEFRGIHTNDVLQLSANQQKQFIYRDAGKLFPEYYVLRIDEFDKKAVTPLDEWILFLKTGDIPKNAKAGGLAEARERLRRDSLSKKEQRAYDAHLEALRYQRSVIQTGLFEGHEKGREEGREEGLEEGIGIGMEKGIEEGIGIGIEKGIGIGIEKGRAEELEKNVLTAYQNNLSIEQIQAFSNLTQEHILEILKRNKLQ